MNIILINKKGALLRHPYLSGWKMGLQSFALYIIDIKLDTTAFWRKKC